jgi:hypothetical protein
MTYLDRARTSIKGPGRSGVSGTRGEGSGRVGIGPEGSGDVGRIGWGSGLYVGMGVCILWESEESMEVLQAIRPGESRVSKCNVIGAGRLGKMSSVDVTGIQWGLSSDSSDILEDFVLIFIHDSVLLQCSGCPVATAWMTSQNLLE